MKSKLPWLSVAVIVIATLIVYQPALNIGFWTDDFWYVEMAGRLSTPEYLRAYFDPALQWRWYRPMQGMQWWVEYAIFRGEPVGYHYVQIILHALNAMLLFFLVHRMTRKLRVGLVAVLLYLAISAYAIAVFQPSVVDPLLAPFYLLTLWFWLDYLEQGRWWQYLLTGCALVAALLTKEVAITLPITLVLLEVWLLQRPFKLIPFVKRYAPFFFLLVPYALFELHALSQGVFTRQLGYGPGSHIFSTLILHLTLLAWPWSSAVEASVLVAGLVAVATLALIYARQWSVLFVAATILLTLLPILPFPPNIAGNPRYLYLSFMGSAIIFALSVDGAIGAARHAGWRLAAPILSLTIALLMLWSNATIAETAQSFGGMARANRLVFRPIYDRHPSFPPDTFLYFLTPRYPNISGLMFLRYGKQVAVSGTDVERLAGLRDYQTAYVFYLDDENVWHDQAVSKEVNARVQPLSPARFGDTIVVQGIELVSDRVRRGDALVVVVYWRAEKKMDRDYTVFAHLVDDTGQMIASVDRPPQEGLTPTRSWSPGLLVPDGVVVPIPPDASPGKNLRLEIGLYDSETLVRLNILGADGQAITDKLTIGPIQIIER